MRLSTLILCLLVSAALAVGFVAWRKHTERRRLWREFVASMEGKDLRKVPGGRERFRRFALKGEVDGRSAATDDFRPWRVVRVGAYVILLEKIEEDAPSRFFIRAHVFTDDGDPLSSVDFSGGWRTELGGAGPFEPPGPLAPVLRLDTSPSPSGRSVAAQMYSVIGGRLALVRLEDRQGRYRSNVYEWPSHTIGPPVPERTPDGWEAALRSDDPLEQLRSLVWIGGLHGEPNEIPAAPEFHEPESEVRRVEAVRSRPGVKARLADLERSGNPWIREAARLVGLRIEGR